MIPYFACTVEPPICRERIVQHSYVWFTFRIRFLALLPVLHAATLTLLLFALPLAYKYTAPLTGYNIFD